MCKKVHESGMRIEAWVNPYRVKSKKVPEKLSMITHMLWIIP